MNLISMLDTDMDSFLDTLMAILNNRFQIDMLFGLILN